MDTKSTENEQQAAEQAQQALKKKNKRIRSLKGKSDAKRTFFEKLADSLTASFGSLAFLLVVLIVGFAWVEINTGLVPGIKPFDPYPFGLLAIIVSFTGVLLAVIVLISQRRESHVAHLRAEIDLQVDTMTEREITKLMQMVHLLIEKNGIDISQDKDLQEMLKPTDMNAMEKILARQVREG